MKIHFTFCLLLLSVILVAQPPTGYYNSAISYSGSQLKSKLFTIIGTHTERTYTNLWTDFQTTDKRADGKVWDMYSNCTFTFGTNQDSGSGGSAECQYYNREHSFPKSWFKDGTPMYSDLFHLYPTDKYVNNQRGNFPFGETTSGTTFGNGSKLGTSSFPGYSGTIFEPIDEYKGDFARSYFYMVTAYESVIESWNISNSNASPHLDGTKYPAFNSWTISLLLKWNSMDPISAKEINRNNAVYGIQHNRNPYIDFPILAEYIWGSHKGESWSLTSGIDELKIVFSIWPSITQNVLNINCDENNTIYRIFDINGQLLATSNLDISKKVALDDFQNGMYLIQLQSGNRKSIQKFIIHK